LRDFDVQIRTLPKLQKQIVALSLFAVSTCPVYADSLSSHELKAVEIFRELIEINTTQSVGDNTKAAQAMADRLLNAGFPKGDVHVVIPAPNKGNLVARLRSPAPTAKPILFLAHIDVVEANPADWSVDPFTFLEREGYFYGRGTLDDKDEAAIAVANLIKLFKEGYRPNRDIIIALTADEEGGPVNGVQHLLAEHRELVDAEFVINEGGGGGIFAGKPLINSVQAAEKVYQSYTLEVTNKGGHSSLPRKDNAIYELVQALTAIQQHDFPVQLNEVTRAYFRQSAQTLPTEQSDAMNQLLADPTDSSAVAILAREPSFNARMRTTCVATQLDAGHAENALPQRAQATVNCRILPGVDPASVHAKLANVINNPGVSITPVKPPNISPPSPLTEEIMAPILAITENLWPGVTVVPVMSTGATDGLFFRQAGIPVYGVAGIMVDVTDIRAHGRDERIRVQSFFEGLAFQEALMRAYTGDK
jgi:acetylornithine deacetylase/succinyl-diaminopimelate desuccinylase-like protein